MTVPAQPHPNRDRDFSPEKPHRPSQQPASAKPARQAIAYSMDALVPGLYFWCGDLHVRLGGSRPETDYPGTLHSAIGVAIVLPGYRIYSTYRGSYDLR